MTTMQLEQITVTERGETGSRESLALCPGCGVSGQLRTIDSRPSSNRNGWRVYRRRKCLACNTRFSTEETLIERDTLYPVDERGAD